MYRFIKQETEFDPLDLGMEPSPFLQDENTIG